MSVADERNEQSVLISLDSLAANEEDKKAGAASGGESGLIDIGALESAGLLDDVDDAGPTMAVAPSSAGAVRTRRRGGGTIVGLVIGAALLTATVVGLQEFRSRVRKIRPAMRWLRYGFWAC